MLLPLYIETVYLFRLTSILCYFQLLAIAPSHDSSDHQLSNHVSSRSRSQTHHLNGYAERAPPPSHMVSRGSAQW